MAITFPQNRSPKTFPKNVRFRLLSNSKGAKCCSLGTNDIPHLAQVLFAVIAKYYSPRALPSSAAAVGVGAVRRPCVHAYVYVGVCMRVCACVWLVFGRARHVRLRGVTSSEESYLLAHASGSVSF